MLWAYGVFEKIKAEYKAIQVKQVGKMGQWQAFSSWHNGVRNDWNARSLELCDAKVECTDREKWKDFVNPLDDNSTIWSIRGKDSNILAKADKWNRRWRYTYGYGWLRQATVCDSGSHTLLLVLKSKPSHQSFKKSPRLRYL